MSLSELLTVEHVARTRNGESLREIKWQQKCFLRNDGLLVLLFGLMVLFIYQERFLGAGEMAQRVRALTALPEVLSSNPHNHMVAHNGLQ